MKRLCLLAALAGLLAVPSQAAAALTAPELFVRQQSWETHEDTGPWMPLAGAPVVNYLGGYEIGVRLQASGEPYNRQRVALTIVGVPDGAPTQPNNTPYCIIVADPPGTIVPAGQELQFEGDGAYRVKVSIGPSTGDENDCLAGPSTTGAFSVDVHVAPQVVGEPLTFRAVPLGEGEFAGVRAAPPPGGEADVQCSLGSLVIPDRSSSHPQVPEDVFPQPGAWSCMARGTAEGIDDALDRATFATPFSAPLPVTVRSDFRRAKGRISRPRSKRPRLTFVAEWPAESAGGSARFTLARVAGCKGRRYKLRSTKRYRGRFDGKRMRVAIRRPRKAGFYFGRFTFAGTPLVRAGVDPYPLQMLEERGVLGFVGANSFPSCPGYRP